MTTHMYRYPKLFILFALGWSWVCWILAIAFELPFGTLMGSLCIGLGGLGPTASALGILLGKEAKQTRMDYRERLVRWRTEAWGWWVLILGFPLVLQLLSILLSIPMGGSKEQFLLEPSLTRLPHAFFFSVWVLLFGPLPEEMGWRGYWLPSLLSRTTWISASILIASFWALWHVPLFFIPGYPLGSLSREPLRLLFYLLDFFPNSLLYTMIFMHSGGSIPGAILFHWSGNFWGMAFETGRVSEGIALLLKITTVVCLNRSIPAGLRGGGLSHTNTECMK